MTQKQGEVALRKLAEVATPGPWKSDIDLFADDEDIRAVVDAPHADMMFSCGTDVMPHRGQGANGWTQSDYEKRDAQWKAARQTQAMRDAAFIAAASPDVVVALLDRIAQLEALLGEACDLAQVDRLLARGKDV